MHTVAVVGASGFVGTAVVEALRRRGHQVTAVPAPRLRTDSAEPAELARVAAAEPALRLLADAFTGADAVVNAAGCPDASSLDSSVLLGANGLLPAVAASACIRAGIRRFVHISSAVVQNDRDILDESEDLRPFSPYSESKVAGERVVQMLGRNLGAVRYRPPSVHAPGRRVTRMVARIAGSPLASVAHPGDQPTPQALLPNVGDAVAFLATTPIEPPAVVMHPSEGVTTGSLMRDLSGGKAPRRLPRGLARAAVRSAKVAGRLHRPTAGNARRVELLWLGQEQARSWLQDQGWEPVVGPKGWRDLGAAGRPGTTP